MSRKLAISPEELHGADRQLAVPGTLLRHLPYRPMIGDFAAAEQAVARLIEVAASLNAPFWITVGRFPEGKLLAERHEFADALLVSLD